MIVTGRDVQKQEVRKIKCRHINCIYNYKAMYIISSDFFYISKLYKQTFWIKSPDFFNIEFLGLLQFEQVFNSVQTVFAVHNQTF